MNSNFDNQNIFKQHCTIFNVDFQNSQKMPCILQPYGCASPPQVPNCHNVVLPANLMNNQQRILVSYNNYSPNLQIYQNHTANTQIVVPQNELFNRYQPIPANSGSFGAAFLSNQIPIVNQFPPQVPSDADNLDQFEKYLEKQMENFGRMLKEVRNEKKEQKKKENQTLTFVQENPAGQKSPVGTPVNSNNKSEDGLIDFSMFWNSSMNARVLYLFSLIKNIQTDKNGKQICIYQPSTAKIARHFHISSRTIKKVSDLYKLREVDWKKNSNRKKRVIPEQKYQGIKKFLDNQATEFWPKSIGKVENPEVLSVFSTKKGLFSAYLQSVGGDGVVIKTFIKYMHIINKNLILKTSASDVCNTCRTFDNIAVATNDPRRKETLKVEKLEHRKIAFRTRCAYEGDQQLPSSDALVVAFDFKQNISLPFHLQQAQQEYYTSVFNVNVFCIIFENLKEKKYHPLIWEETKGGKTLNEIGTCLLSVLQQLQSKPDNIIVWVDNCSYQNKNFLLFVFLLFLVSEKKVAKSICFKYFVSGHSHFSPDMYFAWMNKIIKGHDLEVISDILDLPWTEKVIKPTLLTTFYDFISKFDGKFVQPKGIRPLTELFVHQDHPNKLYWTTDIPIQGLPKIETMKVWDLRNGKKFKKETEISEANTWQSCFQGLNPSSLRKIAPKKHKSLLSLVNLVAKKDQYIQMLGEPGEAKRKSSKNSDSSKKNEEKSNTSICSAAKRRKVQEEEEEPEFDFEKNDEDDEEEDEQQEKDEADDEEEEENEADEESEEEDEEEEQKEQAEVRQDEEQPKKRKRTTNCYDDLAVTIGEFELTTDDWKRFRPTVGRCLSQPIIEVFLTLLCKDDVLFLSSFDFEPKFKQHLKQILTNHDKTKSILIPVSYPKGLRWSLLILQNSCLYHVDSSVDVQRSNKILQEHKKIFDQNNISCTVKIVQKENLLQEGACMDSGLFLCFFAELYLSKTFDLNNPDKTVQQQSFGRSHGVFVRNKIMRKIVDGGDISQEKKDLISQYLSN